MNSITTESEFAIDPAFDLSIEGQRRIELADGQSLDIRGLSFDQLIDLQCQQEPLFAKAIAESPKDSVSRQQITQTAYQSVCAILDEQSKRKSSQQAFSMGMDARYVDLVLRLLEHQESQGVRGGLFELGCSTGCLLEQIDRAGYRVGGLEVVDELLSQAKQRISNSSQRNLYLGDFRKIDLTRVQGSFSVAYWNDVFEHIPTDEILDYLRGLWAMLKPGGMLVTITPNWHMRPSDITAQFRPARSEAEGFHLKEYSLAEVRDLLLQAGFEKVTTPTYISRGKIHWIPGTDFTGVKCLFEPFLERLPFKLAVQFCRRFGLNCTIAQKSFAK